MAMPRVLAFAAFLILGASTTPFLALLTGAAADEPATPRLPGPPVSFETDEAADTFRRGREHFVRGSWKEAQECFAACRKGAAGDEARAALDKWTRACTGAKDLAAIEKEMTQERWRPAWSRYDAARAKFGDTPLRFFLDPLGESIARQIFVPLATYEANPPPSEIPLENDSSPHAEYETSANFVRGGLRSLCWRPKVDEESITCVQLARFEGSELEKHRTFEFSIYNPEERLIKFLLILHLGDLDEIASNTGSVDEKPCFYYRVAIERAGWNEVVVDLQKDLRPNGKPALAAVCGALLVDIVPPKEKTVYIDDVRFGR